MADKSMREEAAERTEAGRKAADERVAAEEIAAARKAADERQQALEIIGGAIGVLMPDFRASGSVTEHAAKVAAELGRRFGEKRMVAQAAPTPVALDIPSPVVGSHLALELFRQKWAKLHPLSRAAYAHHIFDECTKEMARHATRAVRQIEVLSERRMRVSASIAEADRIVASLFLSLMHEADDEADKLVPQTDVTTNFKMAF